MACTNCGGRRGTSCQVVLADDCVSMTGSGTAADPYVVSCSCCTPVGCEGLPVLALTVATTAPGQAVTFYLGAVGADNQMDWGDGAVETLPVGSSDPTVDGLPVTHTYADAGTYQAVFCGTFARMGASSQTVSGIVSVDRWDERTGTTNLNSAFWGAQQLVSVVPPPTTVTNLNNTFRASRFNGSVDGWQTGNVTTMVSMFNAATAFNQDLSSWDTSALTGAVLANMFNGATAFNGDVSTWDVSGVTALNGTFLGATAFNQDVSSWDVSAVTTLRGTFRSTTAFNQDIGGWDTAAVVDMRETFMAAAGFNQDLSGWNTDAVTSHTDFNTGANATWVGNAAFQPVW